MDSLKARAKPGVEVFCGGCRHAFRQDPPFEVRCPDCGARPGSYCNRPSGHSGPFVPFHAARDLEALRLGFYDHIGASACGPNSESLRASRILKGEVTKKRSQKLIPAQLDLF